MPLCLGYNPDALNITGIHLVPRRCSEDKRWTTWRATGFRMQADEAPNSTFVGFIEHIAIGEAGAGSFCITYNLLDGWMGETSNRGTLELEDCSQLNEVYKDFHLEKAFNEEYEEFLNVIRLPLNYKYDGKTLAEIDNKTTTLSRRVYPMSKHQEMEITNDEQNFDITRDGVCGFYGKYGEILSAAVKANKEKPDWPNWSMMADYIPDESCSTEVKKGRPKKSNEATVSNKCDDADNQAWQWGCGLGSLEFNPPFLSDKLVRPGEKL
ncbi:hypothetical protein ABW20_dc0106526 [Dactylellina cionopaga]|nr:hypothetical protein ABW20_dc0106526 [Dactylellina cionopaga]